MNKSNYYKFLLFVSLAVLLLSLSSCAITQSVREVNKDNVATLVSENNAKGTLLYSNCSDQFSDYQIVISYKISQGDGEFPPYDEGYIAIADDNELEYIFPPIEHDGSSEHYSYPTSLQKIEIWQITGPDKENSFWSGYEYTTKDLNGKLVTHAYRSSKLDTSAHRRIKVKFIKKNKKGYSFETNCTSFRSNTKVYDVIFKDASLKYSIYKNSKAFRIVATPFAFILDVVTFPIQFLIGFGSGEWIPR